MADLLSTLTYGTLGLIVGASVPQKLALYNTFRDLANEKHLFVYPDRGSCWATPAARAEHLSRTSSQWSISTLAMENQISASTGR